MSDAILREVKDGLCTITLNKPDKLNALGTDSFKGLADACDYIASHVSEIGCVLIKGSGRAFCAGNDLGGLTEVFEGGDSSRFRSDTVERLASLPMPVVAQVHGHCLTGGLELALAADIIKQAMIDIDHWLSVANLDAQMVLQVHDELVFEVAEKDLKLLMEGVRFRMVSAASLSVPLVVDMGHGPNWDEAH